MNINLKNNTAIRLIIITIITLILFISSILHRLQLPEGNQIYTTSLLVNIEMISMILLFILHFINFITFIIHIFKKNWGTLLLILAISIPLLILLFASMKIDEPTLLYMT